MSDKLNYDDLLRRPHERKNAGDIGIDAATEQEILLVLKLTKLDRSDMFSLFFPSHREIAAKLVNYFISIESIDKLKKVAQYARDKVNVELFSYAFSMALLHRKDTQGVLPLSPAEICPDRFFPAPTILDAVQELEVVPEGSRNPVAIPNTATKKYAESVLEYFRCDLGFNVSYYYWHFLHPAEAVGTEIVDADRHGELWCYFHQQIIARYNAERYCNGLLPVVALTNFDEPIPEGYFPTLCTQHTHHSWAPRCENTQLDDLRRPFEGLSINKSRLRRWIDRLCNAIESGFVTAVSILCILIRSNSSPRIL